MSPSDPHKTQQANQDSSQAKQGAQQADQATQQADQRPLPSSPKEARTLAILKSLPEVHVGSRAAMEKEASRNGIRFQADLALIPPKPGVYLMKDDTGQVIYVGKAKVLPNRLKSYFCAHPAGTAKVLAMIRNIADFSYILCANELEALILENNLIKEYQPKYNVLLRDDKEYPYLKITWGETYPRLLHSFHAHEAGDEASEYFGPFLPWKLKEAIQAIYQIFPMKRCRYEFPADLGKVRPCLYYHIGKCRAPCTGEVTPEAYRKDYEQIAKFLRGSYDGLIRELEKSMADAAQALAFEKAGQIRDQIKALKALMEKQSIYNVQTKANLDILGLARNQREIAVQVLAVREGRMIHTASYFLPDQEETAEEILQAVIPQIFDQRGRLDLDQDGTDLLDLQEESLESSAPRPRKKNPDLILGVPLDPDYEALLEGYLARKLVHPQRGYKKDLCEMAERNARETLLHRSLTGADSQGLSLTLDLLAALTGLDHRPDRIEAYDIANFGASTRAASMVVFVQGKPKRSEYRHFTIQSFEGIDDYQAMAETLDRRLKNFQEKTFGFTEAPDLILIDGGLGHVHKVYDLIRAALPETAVCGTKKDPKHQSSCLVFADGSELELREPFPDRLADHFKSEEIYSNRLYMAEDPAHERAYRLSLLRLISACQDEAHRFANRLNNSLHRKKSMQFSLEDIPGIGPARRKKLLQAFKTVQKVKEATAEEIAEQTGLSMALAEQVYTHFHPKEET